MAVLLLLTVLGRPPVAHAQSPSTGTDAPDQQSDGPAVEELPPLPDYLLEEPAAPCVGASCGPFQLVDLGYRQQAGDAGAARGSFRVRLADLGFIGIEAGGGSTAVSLRTARVEAEYRERHDDAVSSAPRRSLAVTARASRLRLDFRAEELGGRAFSGWEIGGTAAVRLGPALELLVEGAGGTGASAVPGRPHVRRSGGVGVLWQPGDRLEIRTSVAADRLASAAGEELRRWRLETAGILLVEPVRLRLDAGLLRTRGRFERTEARASLDLEVRPWRRLLLHMGAREEIELGGAELGRGIRLGASLFGRDHRFERGAMAAREMRRLVAEARARGFDERLSYGADEIRALRERLAVSSAARHLEARLQRLYRAVVADRNVGRLGVELELDRSFDGDRTRRRVDGFVVVPWPPAPPWAARPDEVELLRWSGSYVEEELSEGVTERGRRWSLEARLHRTLRVELGWSEPPRTALELAVGVEPMRLWTLAIDYSFER